MCSNKSWEDLSPGNSTKRNNKESYSETSEMIPKGSRVKTEKKNEGHQKG